eukprot:scaffold389057_cov42-Prasinocladus_malaysianus.AAC.2
MHVLPLKTDKGTDSSRRTTLRNEYLEVARYSCASWPRHQRHHCLATPLSPRQPVERQNLSGTLTPMPATPAGDQITDDADQKPLVLNKRQIRANK